MVAQLGRAPITSLLEPAFGTNAAVVSSRRQAPCNVRYGGVPHLSSAIAWVPTLSFVGCWGPLAMALGAAGAAFLLAATQRNLSEILVKMAAPAQ